MNTVVELSRSVAHLHPGRQGMASVAMLLPRACKSISIDTLRRRLKEIDADLGKVDIGTCDDGSGDLAISLHESNAIEHGRVMKVIEDLCRTTGMPLTKHTHFAQEHFVELAVPNIFHRVRWGTA